MCCERKKNGKEKDRENISSDYQTHIPKERKKERKNVFCDEGVGKARAKEAKRKRDEENPEREGRSGKEILVLRGRSYEGGKRNRFGLQFER